MNNDHPTLSEVRDKMREDLNLFREAVQRESDELLSNARTWVEQHPYAAVGAAFGVGFLLAGGLFSKATARTLGFGTRFVIGRLMRQLIAGAGAGMAFPSSSR
jgi:hypothetical protein